MHTGPGRADCAALDASDPLRTLREHFDLPEGIVYLDGNSLGAMPAAAVGHLRELLYEEWGNGLIRSWREAHWWEKPLLLGERIAPLLGAATGQVIVGDSTSVDLFKVIVTASRLRPDRHVLVSEQENFPTDLYLLESAAELTGSKIRLVARDEGAIATALEDDVAAVLLSHVDYRSSEMLDMARMSALAHTAGALSIFDLCHSAGAMPLHLDDDGVDFAVGSTYKYLNGGPGSPAFVYAASRHLGEVRQPLPGWGGHARPFAFETDYAPAAGIGRFGSGTPSILSLAGLEIALDLFDRVSLEALRDKSRRLAALVIELVDARELPVELASPRDPERRGSHLAYRHPRAAEVRDALEERGVICDHRPPDLLRLGLAPMYLRFVDCFDAVEALAEVLSGG